jgi:hypothetical protein
LQGFEFYEAVWLTPFGFIIVGVLAFSGHLLIKGFDDFREAKCSINAKSIIKQIQKVKMLFDNLQKIFNSIKLSSNTLSDYEKQLAATEKGPIWLKQAISDGLNDLSTAVNLGSNKYDETHSLNEATRNYYSDVAFTIGCLIILLLFVVVQGNLIDVSKFMTDSVHIHYALAVILCLGGLLAGYSIPRLISLSTKSKYMFPLLLLILLLLVINLCALLIPFNTISEYLILCFIEIILFSILFAFGHKIDTYGVITVILIKIFACFLIAAVIWISASIIYIIGCLSILVYYALYLLGFPILLVVKRRVTLED